MNRKIIPRYTTVLVFNRHGHVTHRGSNSGLPNKTLGTKPARISPPVIKLAKPNGNSNGNSNGHPASVIDIAQSKPNIEVVGFPDRFSNPFSDYRTLKDIRIIWKEGYLFNSIEEPHSSHYVDYLEKFQHALKILPLAKMPHGRSVGFKEELQRFIDNKHFTPLQKAIYSTMGLEMALLGIDTRIVLEQINKAVPSPMRNSSEVDYATGFRNELKAGWFLAKYIYDLKPADKRDFIHSPRFVSSRDPKTFELRKDSYLKEIDIATNDALVSVKSNSGSFSKQIADLFLAVIDDKGLYLDLYVRKLIFIRCKDVTEKGGDKNGTGSDASVVTKQYLPEFSLDRIKKWVIPRARDTVKDKLKGFGVGEEDLFRKLVEEGTEIYYAPSVDNYKDMREWIEAWQERLENTWVSKAFPQSIEV